MQKAIYILILFNLLSSCKASDKEYIIYASNQIKPVVYAKNQQSLAKEVSLFIQLFEEKTAYKPQVIATEKSNEKSTVELKLDDSDENTSAGFKFIQTQNKLVISATDSRELSYGIRYFFKKFVDKDTSSLISVKKITVPEKLTYVNTPDFEYREPYFPLNQDERFRAEFTTDNLEETWGLWGHNIRKVITITPEMSAVVEGEINDEQLCFSSPSLERSLTAYIKEKVADSPELFRYMIMPDDNAIVCMCDQCKDLGNTKTNASPAVFALLNRMATKFPKQEFFSTAYITTKQPPKNLTLAANVGVMLSTMDFPKGVVIENSKRLPQIQKTLDDWNTIVSKIYLWDYAINFDGYFESYPTLSIAQKNLQYYKKQNIKGVFMQGNENSYAAFQDLKCYLYAKILRDTDIDIKKETKLFLDKKYPTVSGLLFAYYTKIEARAMLSKRRLDIYGGLAQAKKKYLDYKEFTSFYDNLLAKVDGMPKNEAKEVEKLLLALSFQKLEFARTNGIGDEGYAVFENANKTATVKKDILETLLRLEALSAKTGISTYNETGFTLDAYLTLWKDELIDKKYQNLLFGKRLKALTELDEDYDDTRMLTDGAIGFNDYFNNWMLVGQSEELRLSIEAEGLHEARLVEISFLNNPKHKIHLPAEVEVNVDGRPYRGTIDSESIAQEGRYVLRIQVKLKSTDKNIEIKITKQPNLKSNSIACDEVVFI